MVINYDKGNTLKAYIDEGKDLIKDIRLILIQSEKIDKASVAYADLAIKKERLPAHYVVDAECVVKYAPSTTRLLPADTTYSSLGQELIKEIKPKLSETIHDKVSGLLGEINSSTDETIVKSEEDENNNGNHILIIEACIEDYDKVSENLTKLIGYMISHHGFRKEQFYRIGDIVPSKENPYQYFHIKDFLELLDNAEAYSRNLNSTPKKSPYCFEPDDHSATHCPFPGSDPEHNHSGHVHHFEKDTRPVPKNIRPIKVDSTTIHEEDFTIKTVNGAVFEVSNFQPDTDQSFSVMESNLYEPIYPDLTTPPRNATSLYNFGVENTKQILEKLTAKEKIEELKRRKAEEDMAKEDRGEEVVEVGDKDDVELSDIDLIEEEEKRKPVLGKIPNFFDPYPIDDKIAQLQHHAPMVTLEFEEAQNVTSNTSFYLINRAINTEKRLVQLENIMTTQMRMLNRLSSRIVINCVYYGGQNVFGKYNGIRCLSDDLINDAAQVTLDQCLNCSRYEPIEGQVYEIMDEDLRPGEANIYDDIQASYMTKNDYVEFTRAEEMNIEDDVPFQDLSKTNERDEDDKNYQELLAQANNFVMNWERKPWDYQSPHISEYEYDFTKIGLDKENRLNPLNKYEDGWRDVTQKKYQRPDYGTNTLGNGTNLGNFDFGSNYSSGFFTIEDYDIEPDDIRIKILNYAKEACDFGMESGAFQYTLGAKIIDRHKTPTELVKDAMAGKEVSIGKTSSDTDLAVYTDCSNFTNYIYYLASGGLIDIPGTTAALAESDAFDIIGKGKSVKDAIKEAIPGDLILYRGVTGGHVTIYAGGEDNYHASYDAPDKTKQVIKNVVAEKSDFVGILSHKKLSKPKLKNITYVDVNITVGDYTKKYQCVPNKNTIDGRDNSYTSDVSKIIPFVDPHVNFTTDPLRMQFALLTHPYPEGYVTAEGIAKYFAKKGKTKTMPNPQAFIDAGKQAGVNPFFLIASCAIETGWCSTSNWMNGSGLYKDPNNGKTLYNAYGLWCYNSDPARKQAVIECSKRGWYTKELAVIEGAKYFAEKYYYENAVKTYGIRNTAYFMKWHMGNLIDGNAGSPGTMQYASDVRFAQERAKMMYDLMECMPGGAAEGMKHMRFIVPKFKEGAIR